MKKTIFSLTHALSSQQHKHLGGMAWELPVLAPEIISDNKSYMHLCSNCRCDTRGERFCPGVGQVSVTDEIKREIIHQLSIRPMAHSELVKALPEDENKETGMEQVIETIASFKKPGLTGRGLYELKPECAKEFNLFYHHYSRAEQSKAEEAQRKLKRLNEEDTALPPPVLPPFCPLFASLINILQSDVMLSIMGTVLQWAVEPNGYSWSEAMLQRDLVKAPTHPPAYWLYWRRCRTPLIWRSTRT
ncbi:hypothetical protein AB205_0165510 [Aquarana catesbeiana]|uniref:E3 ubiquitin-protein ligase n=1 Tax=Aquarana catesbeiana TaxID=8400 RepID=A0A2G9SF20_AQUCT|nr:hypothetical protein AB205_0165510 [Aquarana catesbeiana]